MSGVSGVEAESILGKHYIAVAELLTGRTEAERQAGVHAAAGYIEKNLNAIIASPDVAREIQRMLRQSAEGVSDVGPVLSALESKLTAEPQLKVNSDQQTSSQEVQVNNGEVSEGEVLDRAEHLMEVLDVYLDDVQRNNRGSVYEAKKHLPAWQFEIRSWPKSVSENPTVKVVQAKLLGIENALAKLGLQ